MSLPAEYFKSEVSGYLSRKESLTGNVLQVHRLTDEKIVCELGAPAIKVSVLTDYVPWRMHLYEHTLTSR